jgi:chromosome partitioning protein
LAHKGLKVLLIDLDPQGHLTEGLGARHSYMDTVPSLYELLVSSKNASLADIKISTETMDLVPSNIRLVLAEQGLIAQRGREYKLRSLIEPLRDNYDWIIIDCPPTLGQLTDNALNAARAVLVPVQAEDTSIRALELLFDQIESLERALNVNIQIIGVVATMVEDTNVARRTLRILRENIPAMLPTEIRKRVRLKEAWAAGQSIFRFDPESDLLPTYSELADELIARYTGEGNGRG